MTVPAPFRPDAQLNWLARYLPLVRHLDAPARHSTLEVGSGPVGLGCVVTHPFVGLDVHFAQAPHAPMLALRAAAGPLPFEDAAFDTVVSVDTLEHVPPGARAGFVAELLRVAARRVLLAFPAGEDGLAVDALLARVVRRLGGGEPEWLREHEEHGLPTHAEVERLLGAVPGWRVEALPTTASLPCVLLTLADVVPELRRWVLPQLAGSADALARWVDASDAGPAFRRCYVLEAREPRAARVDLRSAGSLPAALRCPGCGAAGLSTAEDGAWACPACATRYACPSGRPVELVAPARRVHTFLLEPARDGDARWVGAVERYLSAFPADAPCRLWLQVDGARLAPADVLARLEPVLAPLGDRPFPELVLAESEAERPAQDDCIPLGEGEALLAWTPERFRAAVKERA